MIKIYYKWRNYFSPTHDQQAIVRLFVVFVVISIALFLVAVSLALLPMLNKTFDELQTVSEKEAVKTYAAQLNTYIEDRQLALQDIASTPVIVNAVLLGNGRYSAFRDYIDQVFLLGENPHLTVLDVRGNVLFSELDQALDYGWLMPLLDGVVGENFIGHKLKLISANDRQWFELAVPVIYGRGREGILIARFNAAPDKIYALKQELSSASAVTYSKGGVSISSGGQVIALPRSENNFIEKYGIVLTHISSREYAEAQKNKLLNNILVGLLVGAMIVFAALFFLGRRILVLPYQALSEAKNLIRDSERALKDALAFQEIVFENIPDLVFVKDDEFRIIQANSAFLNVYPEPKRHKVLGTTTLEEYDPQEAEAFLFYDREAFSVGASHTEETLLFPDGETRILETKKVRFESSDGGRFILGLARDITAIKAAQQALLESEQRYEVAVEGSAVGLWDYNIITGELFWSDRFKQLVGVKDSEFSGELEDFVSRLHPDDKLLILNQFSAHLDEGSPYDVEYRFKKSDSTYFWAHARGQALWNDQGEAIRVAGSVSDISEKKRAELEREDLVAKLAESNEWLEQFAFACSHDLQEPLRIIRIFSEKLSSHLLDSLSEDELGQRYLHHMTDGAAKAQSLISGILAYSRVDRDTESLQEVDLDDLLGDIKKSFDLGSEEGSSLRLSIDSLPVVSVNKTQLHQLFQNLINNGLKYQAKGAEPQVHISVIELEGFWQVSVKDNGIGIEPRYQKQIFDVFKRLHSRSEYAGAGIGLSICRKVVERHGGKIWVESEFGKGAVFHFTLPKSKVVASVEKSKDVS
jgi:PAS domain S-box-containing protein